MTTYKITYSPKIFPGSVRTLIEECSDYNKARALYEKCVEQEGTVSNIKLLSVTETVLENHNVERLSQGT